VEFVRRWAAVVVCVSAVGCGARAGSEGEAGQPIISGTDDRLEIFQLPPGSAPARNADGVAYLAFDSGFTVHDGLVDIPTQSFESAHGVCSSDRYAAQPIATNGFCTAYLVAPRLVVTAGHCVGFAPVGSDVSQFRLVFGFQMLNATTARTTVAASEIYTTLRITAVCDGGWDCSVLELDRPVTNHTMLQINRSGEPIVGDSVYTIGYPFLLPEKFDGPAPITGIFAGIGLAATQLDVSGGDSGSPIFDAATNVVEATLSGISSSGAPPFDTTDAGCAVEHVATPGDNYAATGQFTTLYSNYVPPFCSGDAGGFRACASSGCGICPNRINTKKYDLYLSRHPNCFLEAKCKGHFTGCSEACPPPSAADSSK
jgi:V8-like Glu-specific endopeptidase